MKECEKSSDLVPRLDRWLASELIKSLKNVPALHLRFKVMWRPARPKVLHLEDAVLHMVSRYYKQGFLACPC